AAWPSASVAPSSRLKEMVVASSASWWFTEVAVGRSAKFAMADSGTMGVAVALTADPVEESRSEGLAEVAVGVVTVLAVVPADAACKADCTVADPVFSAGTYTFFSASGLRM